MSGVLGTGEDWYRAVGWDEKNGRVWYGMGGLLLYCYALVNIPNWLIWCNNGHFSYRFYSVMKSSLTVKLSS